MRDVVAVIVLCWTISLNAVELKGAFTQGGLLIGEVESGSQVYLDGLPVKVSQQGLFVIGFDRDAKLQAQLEVRYSNGKSAKQTLTISARAYAIQHVEGIAKKIMSPSKQDLKRIRAEAQQVKKARAQTLERINFSDPFQWPLKGPITGVFGSQRVYNGVPSRPHYGVDVAAPIGTGVSTPASGKVILAHPDMFYSGGTVIIDHGFGVSSTLMHLSKVLVKEGDEVKPGDMIGEVGATGRATGPHLDWRMNWFKQRIDPQLLVSDVPAS